DEVEGGITMAKKREPRKAAAGSDDLEVLHPERTAIIADRKITVREYGFVEGLRLLPLAEPIIAGLKGGMGSSVPAFESIMGIIAKHADVAVQLMAAAADVEVEWIESLSQDDGQLLLMVWWSVNGPFYLRTAATRAVVAARAGATSTPPSSAPAMEAPPTSAG
ncbi:DUF6631 family protein, partial [Azotobacter beijerinckii]